MGHKSGGCLRDKWSLVHQVASKACEERRADGFWLALSCSQSAITATACLTLPSAASCLQPEKVWQASRISTPAARDSLAVSSRRAVSHGTVTSSKTPQVDFPFRTPDEYAHEAIGSLRRGRFYRVPSICRRDHR